MIGYLILVSLVILWAGVDASRSEAPVSPQVHRQDMAAAAQKMASYQWYYKEFAAPRCRLPHYASDYKAGSVPYLGLPYDWGGMDDVVLFAQKLQNGIAPGSHKWNACDSCDHCTTGVDCSGFISLCWRQPVKYNTNSISQISSNLGGRDFDLLHDMKQGDAFVDPGSHIMLFDHYIGDQPFVYEAAGTPHAVVGRVHSWADLAGYKPIRYNRVID